MLLAVIFLAEGHCFFLGKILKSGRKNVIIESNPFRGVILYEV